MWRLSNAIWGHPIIVGSGGVWERRSTLNPLGVDEGQYKGLTMLMVTGQPIRLGTLRSTADHRPILVPAQYDVDRE